MIRMANAQDAAGIAEVHVASWRAIYRGMVPDALVEAQTVTSRRTLWEGILRVMDWPVFVVDDGDVSRVLWKKKSGVTSC